MRPSYSYEGVSVKVYSQLIGASLENKASDYGSASVIGRIWWNTATNQIKFSDGTSITNVLLNNTKCIFGTNATANNNIRFHRGASGVLQFVQGGDTTAEGTLSTSLNQISAKLENYVDASKPAFGNAGRLIWVSDVGALKVDTGTAWTTLASSTAADRLLAMYDAVVGSAGQVASGVATHSSINTAIGALSAGNSLFILEGTYTENVSLDKQLKVRGEGKGSIISGTWTCTTGADQADIQSLKITDNITFNSGATGIFMTFVHQATGKTLTDNGTDNYILIYRE